MATEPKKTAALQRLHFELDGLVPLRHREAIDLAVAAAIHEAEVIAEQRGYAKGCDLTDIAIQEVDVTAHARGREFGLREAMAVLDRRVDVLRGLVHVRDDIRAAASLSFAGDVRAFLEAQCERAERGEIDCDTRTAARAIAVPDGSEADGPCPSCCPMCGLDRGACRYTEERLAEVEADVRNAVRIMKDYDACNNDNCDYGVHPVLHSPGCLVYKYGDDDPHAKCADYDARARAAGLTPTVINGTPCYVGPPAVVKKSDL